MSLAKSWRMVRLQVETVQRLRDLSAIWLKEYGRSTRIPEPEDRWGHSLDRVVRILLARDEAHRARAARSIASRSARGRLTRGKATQPVQDGA